MSDTTVGDESPPKPSSEKEAEAKQNGSESEAKRLSQWAVRRSPDREGKIEIRLEAPDGTVGHFFMGWLEAYDLSDKLLGQVAELKTAG